MGMMDRLSGRRPKQTIVSSAGGVIKGGSPANPDAIMRRAENWQVGQTTMVDAIPEVGHATRFVENTTSKSRILVEGDRANADALTAQLVDLPIGRVCQNLFSVGEIIVAYKFQGGRTRWDSFAIGEYKYEKNKPLKVRGKDGKFREIDGGWNWFRVYRPDANDRFAAWSTHKPMKDLLESMYVHQLADTAVAQSRLAGAGVFYVPNDEMAQSPVMDGGQPEPGSQEHFEEVLRSAMTDSLVNRKSEDAIVPVFMFGGAEFAEGLRHVLLERVDNAEAFARRMEAMKKRYADGIDLPAEVVTGMGESNHWASWKVDANTWQYYLEPMVEVLAQAILQNFVIPVGEKLGSNPFLLSVTIDGSNVVTKPDKTDAAIRAHSVQALSAEGLLHYAGMDARFIHPLADQPKHSATQPDGQVRMPSSNFRGSEGTPVGDRNFER